MVMEHVAIVGCGVVGAVIAYELSQIPDLNVTIIDRQFPAQAATGASLGVLMGIISQKIKGKAWALRQASIQRYETLIPELEALTGREIPFNRQGILKLYFDPEETESWQRLIEVRQTQGWTLEHWDVDHLTARCPQIVNSRLVGAVYSPQDRQLDPTALTLALVDAAQRNGVDVQLGTPVTALNTVESEGQSSRVHHIQTAAREVAVDWVVVAAGLGTTPLLQTAKTPLDIRPVLGQAMRVKVEGGLGDRTFQPMITGDDIHIVPLGNDEYWVGATVEFPSEGDVGEAIAADPHQLEEVWQGAIGLCPKLAEAHILKTWSGLRPRPHNRPAPIIEPLSGYSNVILAAGHYRNGVLLAPATAQTVRSLIASSH